MELQEGKSGAPTCPSPRVSSSPRVLLQPGMEGGEGVCVCTCVRVCRKASSRGMLALSQPQALGMVRVLTGAVSLPWEGWEQGFIAQNTLGGPRGWAQPVCTEILHLKNENLI